MQIKTYCWYRYLKLLKLCEWLISGSFNNYILRTILLPIILHMYIDKQDLTWNNRLGLICRKAQSTKYSLRYFLFNLNLGRFSFLSLSLSLSVYLSLSLSLFIFFVTSFLHFILTSFLFLSQSLSQYLSLSLSLYQNYFFQYFFSSLYFYFLSLSLSLSLSHPIFFHYFFSSFYSDLFSLPPPICLSIYLTLSLSLFLSQHCFF